MVDSLLSRIHLKRNGDENLARPPPPQILPDSLSSFVLFVLTFFVPPSFLFFWVFFVDTQARVLILFVHHWLQEDPCEVLLVSLLLPQRGIGYQEK